MYRVMVGAWSFSPEVRSQLPNCPKPLTLRGFSVYDSHISNLFYGHDF